MRCFRWDAFLLFAQLLTRSKELRQGSGVCLMASHPSLQRARASTGFCLLIRSLSAQISGAGGCKLTIDQPGKQSRRICTRAGDHVAFVAELNSCCSAFSDQLLVVVISPWS